MRAAEERQKSSGGGWGESLIIAFSMYSRIPMPLVPWSDRGMKHALCFFPLVGAAIGIVMALYGFLSARLGLGTAAFALIGTALPILVTGGIHMDGFLDTLDARSSCQSRERKLEILKDPHAGAFAVIGCSVYILLYAGLFSLLDPAGSSCGAMAGIYVMTRALSGWSVVAFPKARQDGLASTFSSGADHRTVKAWLFLWYLAGAGYVGMGFGLGLASVFVGISLAVWGWYYRMAMKEFGGITGDLAGYFLQMAELAMLAGLAVWKF